VSESESLVK